MNKKILLVLFSIYVSFLFAQTPKTMSSSEIMHGLRKLKNVTSVLYIAAHPDDENTRLLSYLANEVKARTGYLSLTRGDGGQNLIGKEQSELLGVIRTQELLAARSTDGAEQFFTRANDFGFSKDPEETFSFWNKDSILSDVVLTIRRFKPDVIICRFPATGEGGHGHHTASAILALEAFDAAADPGRFPEQLKTTAVWKAKRIFWNTFNFGSTNTTSPDQLKVDVGGFNPLLGRSYGEIASESRSSHKSQGFGTARQRGKSIEYFKLLKGDSARSDLFEGIVKDWNRFKGQEKILRLIDICIRKFDLQNPEKSTGDLVSVYNQIKILDGKDPELSYWKKQKLKETEELILACSGLWLEASSTDHIAIPGQDMSFNVQVVKRNPTLVKLNHIIFPSGDTTPNLDLKNNELYTFKRKEKLPATLVYSNPYWLNEKHEMGMYKVYDPELIGAPERENSAKVVFDITIAGLPLRIGRRIVFKSTDPVKGEIYRPLEILPEVTINFPEKVFVFTDGTAKSFSILVKANASNVSGTLNLKAGTGWKVKIANPDFIMQNKGEEILISVSVIPDQNAIESKLEASVNINGKIYNQSIRRIEYDHIPYQFILSDADANLVNIDLKKTGTEIGYIPGAGDDVSAALKQIGYNVTILNDEILSTGDLYKFNAIITGIRAYNKNDRLQVHYKKLMEYVNNGGNLIVQYNTNNRIGPVQAKIGPYPFTISRDRVTDEKAEVRIINDKHPALNVPNKITQKDFEGWIQERGIYFATETDPQYEKIFSMNDPGEKPSEGSLIIGKYGKGNFVYTGLVFFRELPAGIPGSYRLFVNLLSLPQNK